LGEDTYQPSGPKEEQVAEQRVLKAVRSFTHGRKKAILNKLSALRLVMEVCAKLSFSPCSRALLHYQDC